jgi:hypothetical protein
MRFGRWVAIVGLGLVVFFGAAAFLWRESILRTWLDPKQPFQTYLPPAEPNYDTPGGWALIPADPALWSASDPPADVFFIHPTTFDGGRNWNSPIDDRRANRLLTDVMLPNYAGPFQRVGRVFAPRYRQASLYAFMTNREDAQDSRRFAYGDVKRAFQVFLRDSGGRPIVIVGVEQGGALAARLLDDVVAPDPKLRARLAAAYFIDVVVPAEHYAPGSAIAACARPQEPRCVVAWMQVTDGDDASRSEKRALVWSATGQLEDLRNRAPLCVNPLLGGVGAALAPIRMNLGAASASGLEWGVRPAFMPRQVSAQCVDGVLTVSKPASPSLKPTGGWTDRLKEGPFNLFYADEEADAKQRVAALTRSPGYLAPTPSFGATIDVIPSPIHRIP